MSNFHVILFLFIYSLCNSFTKGVTQEDETRENFQEDNQQLSYNLNNWSSNQNLSNKNNNILEGWVEVQNWPKDDFKLGQAAGVCLDSKGFVYVFHRGDRQWGTGTFSFNNILNNIEKGRGPISVPTVLIYHPTTGQIITKWGQNMFYMPHGITVDQDDNVWMTDVALHQVFKYSPLNVNPTAELILGESFVPGNGATHFCQPTSVAVTPSGDFFVADGYCNSRIIKFGKDGTKKLEWGRSDTYGGIGQPPSYMFEIPHALTYVKDKNLVCAADRENGRVLCFDAQNGTFVKKLYSNDIGPRLFSVSYSPVGEGLFFIVNGPVFDQSSKSIKGCVLTASNQQLFHFGVNKLKNPHDIAVMPDGKIIYVVEIYPFKLWKFESNEAYDKFLNANSSNKTLISPEVKSLSKATSYVSAASKSIFPGQLSVAIIVTSAAILFSGGILVAALIYSRAKRRGMSLEDEALYLETINLVNSDY